MEKRLVAAIVLTVAFLFVYSSFMQPPDDSPGGTPPESAAEPAAPSAAEPRVRAALPAPEDVSDITVETNLYRAVFSPVGAGIKSFRLKNFKERWKPVEEIDREISGLESRIARTTSEIVKIRTRIRGESDPSRLANLEAREEALKEEQAFLERAKAVTESLKQQVMERKQNIRSLELLLSEETDPLKIEGLRNRIRIEEGVELIPPEPGRFNSLPPAVAFPALNADMEHMLFNYDKNHLIVSDEDNTLRFASTVQNGLLIEKTYAFSNDSYAIDFEFRVVNNTRASIREPAPAVYYSPGIGLVESAPARGVITGIISYVDGSVHTDKIVGGRTAPAPASRQLRPGHRVWTAIKAKYFAAALIPHYRGCVLSSEKLPYGGKRIGITHPEVTIGSGEEFSKKLTLYLGPQDPDELARADATLKEIIDYGFWSPVAKVIDYTLRVFNNVFNNFGIAIIMLSLAVKIVFYPLTHKSFIAMRKMQEDMKAIQPKINELKKKYGNNQQKLNKATMDLYKKEGVNPMSGCKGGCFPMLLQMPVFFALYAVLNTSIDLRGAHFVGWITDLSMPDPLRILPVLMGVSMFWQQKQTGGAAAGGPQQDQAKMMQWMMPVMLTFIFFGMPAGIVLYWLSFNIFTSLQQMIIRKYGS